MDELKCEKCKGTDIESHDVNEVGGVAVGPYTIHRCEDCHYEWYDHT